MWSDEVVERRTIPILSITVWTAFGLPRPEDKDGYYFLGSTKECTHIYGCDAYVTEVDASDIVWWHPRPELCAGDSA